jgi:hypothetical protein
MRHKMVFLLFLLATLIISNAGIYFNVADKRVFSAKQTPIKQFTYFDCCYIT